MMREDRMRRLLVVTVLAMIASATDARAQDVAAGEKVYAVCKTCHQIGPNAKNAIGPVLNGVIGRAAGTYSGYAYSAANNIDSGDRIGGA
jgi:cytochrome c